MKQSFLTGLILSLGIIQSCSTTQPSKSESATKTEPVATIQNRAVTLEELKTGYTGSLESDSVRIDELRSFLPSYVDYRLKILEGRSLGYFNDPDIQSEYKTYAKEVAEKQWMNNEIESRILNTFKDRSRKELLAFHILITAQDPDLEESVEIKKKLTEARKEILEGADPDSVNKKYSSIQNGNYAGGYLPWITAGRTVTAFEDALYSLEPGEVSMPFQTQFGFHIILLMDERPRTPEKFIKHLFISKQAEDDPDSRIVQALDSLEAGKDWNDVVNEFSDDRRTASRGGEIGWVGYGMQFPESFVDEALKISEADTHSDIIEMDYGFHIIKVDSVRDLSDEKAMELYAETELERLGRLQPGKEELYKLLKEVGGLSVYRAELEQTAEYLIENGNEMKRESTIAEFDGKPIRAEQFIDFYEQEIGMDAGQTVPVDEAFEQFVNRIIESNLIELTKDHFDEYRFEMEQFLNGLVVFKVNEEFLWNPEAADEQLLLNRYEKNQTEYFTEKTITYYRVTAAADSAIQSARAYLLENENPETLNDEYENLILRPGSVSNRSSELFQKLNNFSAGDITEIENNETWHQFYYITEVEPPRQKTFEEAKAEVFNEVREQHENSYLQLLREKYQSELFPENVE